MKKNETTELKIKVNTITNTEEQMDEIIKDEDEIIKEESNENSQEEIIEITNNDNNKTQEDIVANEVVDDTPTSIMEEELLKNERQKYLEDFVNKIATTKNIFSANFGETQNTISASFKKNINLKPYHNEEIFSNSSIIIEKSLNGLERGIIQNILQIQSELNTYSLLRQLEQIDNNTYLQRKENLMKSFKDFIKASVQIFGEEQTTMFFDNIIQTAVVNTVVGEK